MIISGVETITKIKIICSKVLQNSRDHDSISELKTLIHNASPTIVKSVEAIVFSVFYPILKTISENNSSFSLKEKQAIVETFKTLFDKISIDKLPLFFNIYGFLLFEIYDHQDHRVLNVSEEYKLSIVECMTSLANCLEYSAIIALYQKENAPKLCQMLFVMLNLAKNEQFKTLRLSAINCVMAIAHVLKEDEFNDHVLREQVAQVFLFFLPGISSQLRSIALIDEKFGHKIPTAALKAWSRIVILLMQDYNASDRKVNLENIKLSEESNKVKRWTTEKELKDYLKNTDRSPEWFKETDSKLQKIVSEFSKLTHHSHINVRFELGNMATLVIENCLGTMPKSISHLIEIVITLSGDSDPSLAKKSNVILQNLSQKLTQEELKTLFEDLEEGFYNVILSLPRKFNGIDEKEQIAALNLLIGYIDLFGSHNLSRVLHSTMHLHKLLLTLIHISEFDNSSVSLLEEYQTIDLECDAGQLQWKKYRYFRNSLICEKMETICYLLGKFGASRVVSDFLLNTIETDLERKREAILFLNYLIAGMDQSNLTRSIIKNIINIYTDDFYWNAPLSPMVDEFGDVHSLGEVKQNIIQVCLLVEGIGKIALAIKTEFHGFLLKTLYLVLDRAGSSHPLIRTTGSTALLNIALACNYNTITNLISNNIDYFSFHVERKLNKTHENESALNVLAVVMRYSNIDVMDSTSNIIRELLMHTVRKREKIMLNAYLRVFKLYVQSLHRWLNITIQIEPLKSKLEKQQEYEDFRVSNIEKSDDFSDDIMEKTAEELYKEDLGKNGQELDDEMEEPEESYKKRDPPIHIKLTVDILGKSVNFLPSKDRIRKLLVLEIIRDGIEILKDWEDELLPIVHKIWSPLVNRFKEVTDPLIINLSFQLLATLARLSKDFIRSRTSKEVLPSLITVLTSFAKESYLKDKGSAYRYTQSFKLQLEILEKLGRVLMDLDITEEYLNTSMGAVFLYTSDKQPIPLQTAALEFFKTLITFDPEAIKKTLELLLHKNDDIVYEKNKTLLYDILK